MCIWCLRCTIPITTSQSRHALGRAPPCVVHCRLCDLTKVEHLIAVLGVSAQAIKGLRGGLTSWHR